MRIEQLEYIVSVAETQSFSKTAQILHISQSAISQSVLKLEEELGVKIFVRSPSGVKPTVEGIILIEDASNVLMKLKKLQENARLFSKSGQNELNIGLVTGLHLPFLPKILAQIKKEYPYQLITFQELSSIEIIKKIINKELDIGIVVVYENTINYQDAIVFHNFHEIKFFVFVEKHSPLATFSSITPHDLLEQTFVMYNGEYMNWFFDRFNIEYGPFETLFTSSNNETIRETVRKGLAITIETEAELLNNPYIKNGELIAIPLLENIQDKSFLGLARAKNKSNSIETTTFVKMLESHLQEMFNTKSIQS